MNFKIRYLIIALFMLAVIKLQAAGTIISFNIENHKEDTLKLQGDWQYFDSDSSYNEITIVKGYAYATCEECGDPEKIKITQTKNSLTFADGEFWKIKTFHNNSVEVIINNKIIVLYKLSTDGTDNVQSFYEWVFDPNRNGNGVMIFHRDMAERKEKLKAKINTQIRNKN